MPNWTSNSVIVSAKTEAELTEFLDFCEQPHTSQHINWKTNEREIDENAKGVFWNFVTPTDLEAYWGGETVKPTPEGVDVMQNIMEEMATGMDWYHWNVRNWGTKWDITLERDEIPAFDQNNDGDWYFHWYFDTAWSPAVEAYDAMAKRFPNLSFNFEITEEAGFFAGILIYAGGELVSDTFIDSPTHSDYIDVLDIPCPECGWADTGNCLDNVDEDVIDFLSETEKLTTTQTGE
jgi:hypothetical protein